MTPSHQARAMVLSRIRAALGVAGRDRTREAAVEDRLRAHPRGTIPARAHASREALLELMTTMLAAKAPRSRAQRRQRMPCAPSPRICATMTCPPDCAWAPIAQLAALPWDVMPGVELVFGPANGEDRAGLSRAVAAAAETGTLFLVSGADNPTTLAFLPETHFILIRAGDVVGSYEEAFDRLRAIYGEGTLPRTVNLISGPSRTADIEQTIVRGAHGPKRLHVVILG